MKSRSQWTNEVNANNNLGRYVFKAISRQKEDKKELGGNFSQNKCFISKQSKDTQTMPRKICQPFNILGLERQLQYLE